MPEQNKDEQAQLTTPGQLASIEEALRAVRASRMQQTMKKRRGMRKDSLEARLKEKGLWPTLAGKLDDGATLAEIQVWLKRDHGIEISLSSLSKVRARYLGRKVARSVLHEIERMEQYMNPIRTLVTQLRRLDERYTMHVQMEAQLGMPLHDQGLAIAKEIRETNQALVEVLTRTGMIDVPPLKVKGALMHVEPAAEEKHDVAQMLLEALELRLQTTKGGDCANGGRTPDCSGSG